MTNDTPSVDPLSAAAKAARLPGTEDKWRCDETSDTREKFKIGDRVTKRSGSSWTGHIVGTYSTTLTPEGYAVESENEPGSVQIYPAAALTEKSK